MLRAVSTIAHPNHQMLVFDRIAHLPVFSPDLESSPLPDSVRDFISLVEQSDGLIIASPEYVKSIPGGLKNAIDWLVSREEIGNKPITLMHASNRGDDMLVQLRLVLATVSTRFSESLFLRFELLAKSPEEVADHLAQPRHRQAVTAFIRRFAAWCDS